MYSNSEFPREQEEVNKFFKFIKNIYKSSKGDKELFVSSLKKNRTIELGDEESYYVLYDIAKTL